ncbi:MAG: hypothetical protein PUJ43_02815 [Bacillales bacterium]|nr:hypothetical protein [Bacillales bacterium]MDY5919789.1 hypothetical protein [Candidatus Enteromonas sp.]
MKKHLLTVFGSVVSLTLLCSAGYGEKLDYDDFTAPYGRRLTSFGYNPNTRSPYLVGTEYQMECGQSTVGISQYMKWKVTSITDYNETTGGYIYDYDPIFINPSAVTDYSLSLTTAWSAQYSFSFTKMETREMSNRFAGVFGYSDFTQVEASFSTTYQSSHSSTYTWSFGTETSVTRTYSFALDRVPSQYLATPCLIANAKIVSYSFTMYDRWLSGDKPVLTPELVNASNTVLIVDRSTVFITIGIKKVGEQGKPQRYLDCL